MLVAIVALFVALGGSSYAALALPKNSVGSRQLKKNSVTSVKVKAGSLLASDFKASQRKQLQGPDGKQGPAGEQGVPGPQGAQGDTGPAGPFPDGAIPAGQTIRGTYGVRGESGSAYAAVSFGFRLASEPVSHFIPFGGTPPAGCPGTVASPEAQTGHLCVYEALQQNRDTASVNNPVTGSLGAAREGALIIVSHTGDPGQLFSRGTWAVTSP